MVNYNLAEFKEWLEQNPTQKAQHNNWDSIFRNFERGSGTLAAWTRPWNWEEIADPNHQANQNRNGTVLTVIRKYMSEVRERRASTTRTIPVLPSMPSGQRRRFLPNNPQQRITELEQQIEVQKRTIDNMQTQLQTKQTRIRELEEQERACLARVQKREQDIQAKQREIIHLQSQLTGKSEEVQRLQGQVNSLTSQKQALEERRRSEQQEALRRFNQEKGGLERQMRQTEEQKETYQKSCEYLRESLKETEKSLEEVRKELEEAKESKQQGETNHQRVLAEKVEELRQRNEAFKVVQERNVDLTGRLSGASGEIEQLSQWISKLEGASSEGDAFSQLKKELASSQAKIERLEEELKAKKPRSYWWVYLVLVLVGIYFIVK
jgi:uncharacterized coiled-coil protein SlyX